MGKQQDEQTGSETQQIQDAGDLRKYRIELPNLYDDSDLDPYEFRLLAHYKRVGNCNESTRTTAEKCKMSVGKVSEARDSLHAKGFIVIDEFVSKYDTLQITVVDRWAENFAKYAKMKADKQARSQGEQTRSPHEQGCSPHETKKELKEEVHTHPKSEEPEHPTPRETAWKELSEVFPMTNGYAWQKFDELWRKFPDPRRHAYAIARARKANPAKLQFYLEDFCNYDPDKPKTWGEGKPAARAYQSPRYQRPEPVSRLRVRTD